MLLAAFIGGVTFFFGPILGASQVMALAEVGYTHLDLPGNQNKLVDAVVATGKPEDCNAFGR